MRKFLMSMLGLSVAAILTIGIIGSGAMFTFTGTASQDIAIGTLDFELSSTTSGATWDQNANTVTCPALAVTASSNWTFSPVAACNVTLTRTGDIAAAINVWAKVQPATTLAASSLDSFVLSATGPSIFNWTPRPLSTPNADPDLGFQVGVGPSPAQNSSVTYDFAYDWGQSAGTDELVNTDMGKTVLVTYTFTASN